MKISIGILSGGKNRRMGRNKAQLKYRGETFLEHLIGRMKNYEDIIISVDDMEKYQHIDEKLVEDEEEGIGPILGIYNVLEASENDWVFICGVDMPFINEQVVEYLSLFASNEYDAIVMKEQKRAHPLCAVYNKRVGKVAREQIEKGNYKLFDVLNNIRTKYVPIELSCLDKKVLKNINTPNEYDDIAQIPVVSFCGIKNTGKTTYIEGLIKELSRLGVSVGVLKHDGHEFDIDHEGTDTYNFKLAGAREVGIFSDNQYAFMAYNMDTSEKNILDQYENVGIIIVEGLKDSNYDKFELIRKDSYESLHSNEKNLLGIISDDVNIQIGDYEIFDYYKPKDMALYLQNYIEKYRSY